MILIKATGFRIGSFSKKIHQPFIRYNPLFLNQLEKCLSTLKNPISDRDNSSRKSSWIDEKLPSSWIPYAKLARLDKPIGSNLLYIPCTWSILMAYQTQVANMSVDQPLKLLGLFYAGSIAMRGAGCIINDMWDRDFDKKVTRTKNRPLASGEISMRNAYMFLFAHLMGGLTVLSQLNLYSVALGASSMGLVVTYPLAKRFTKFPQAVLGMTFNWGALLGWSALLGSSDWSVTLSLYMAGVSWTMIYDTIYAHQDKSDDIKIGVNSTALTFGDKTKKYSHIFNTVMLSSLIVSGISNAESAIYYAAVMGGFLNTRSIINKVNLNDSESCAQAFKKFQLSGWIITLGLSLEILGKLYL